MITYALAEWRLWKNHSLRKTLPVIVIVIFAAGVIPYLQPFFLCSAFSALSIALGWNYGNRFRPGTFSRSISEGHDEATVAGGRFLSSLMIWFLLIIVGSPPLIFVMTAWMLSEAVISGWMLVWFSAFILAMGLAFLSSLVFGSSDHLIGAYVAGIWLVPGIFVEPLRAFNPFFQAWGFARGENVIPVLIGLAVELALAAAAFLASARLLSKQRRRKSA